MVRPQAAGRALSVQSSSAQSARAARTRRTGRGPLPADRPGHARRSLRPRGRHLAIAGLFAPQLPACAIPRSAPPARSDSDHVQTNPDPSARRRAIVGVTLFFTAAGADGDRELWRSDGTEAGTVRVKDICPGPCTSRPALLTDVNGTLFFTASDGAHDAELWRSDGTAAGTVLVKDIRARFSSEPGGLTAVNGALFFAATDDTGGRELWKSDGTEAGTVRVKDICSGSCSSFPGSLTNVNGMLFFTAVDSAQDRELWRSDGTETGTVRVKDICTPNCSSGPTRLTDVNGTLFFVPSLRGGEELWKSPGALRSRASR